MESKTSTSCMLHELACESIQHDLYINTVTERKGELKGHGKGQT